VSEVQFGETATGAAILQGSFVGADQSHARSFGGGAGGAGGSGAFKRVEGSNSREIRDAHGKFLIS
jgi:transcription factor IIIB subunit 2